jgi:hypothetical protein
MNMETELPEENQEEIAHDSSDWDNRVLCSDGNCIGVIGSDGRCKECGKKYEGDLPSQSPSQDEDQDREPVAQEDEHMSSAETETHEVADDAVDDEWENRVLCSDGACIGVIGPDGKCKECGKPLE